MPRGGGDDASGAPDDAAVVRAAAEAAEDVVFSRYSRSDVRDLDVTITFEDGQLEVDVYIDAPDGTADPQQVAEDAALAARGVADEMLSETGG
ncbi:DUF3194 domain-containing protein [Halobacteriales archaeon QH_2_65_14]|nr:MAG: DUF3194 domain-containing protein [Halobacteriales archaeon QH_2_65_14]